MTVLPLSREHPVWPSCLYHGYTVYSPVHEWPPLAGDCSSTWEQTSLTGGLITLKSTTMDLNHCVQKLPSATRRPCYAVCISTQKLQTTSLNNACPNWVMPYCKPMMILFFSATWIAATKSNVIKDLCDLYDLKNLIKDPTCHKGAASTLLDNILVSNHRRYTGALNANFNLSDCHNLIGAATRRFAPIMKPRKIFHRSYKHFCEADYLTDLSFAPFHVADIFDDIDDIAWFSSSLIRNVIDAHAPVKSKIITKQSVPYMHSKLRKAQYARNMARNKFQQFGKAYCEENRGHRNNVAKIRKSSMRIYFEKNCKTHDKQFWRKISPFMSDKKFRNGGNIILNENGETKTDAAEVSEIFNDFFISTASEIGHNEDIASVPQAIDEYANHPSVMMIKRHYDNVIENFDFHSVDANDVMIILKNINPTKATGYDLIPGKLIRIAHRELSAPLFHIINTSINLRSFPGIIKCAEVSPVYKKILTILKRITIDPWASLRQYRKLTKLFWMIKW